MMAMSDLRITFGELPGISRFVNLVRFGFVQLCVAVFELSSVANFCVGKLGSGSAALLA